MKYALSVPFRYLVAVLIVIGVFLLLSAGVTFTTADSPAPEFVLRSLLAPAGAAAAVIAAYYQLFALIRVPRPAFLSLVMLFLSLAALLVALGLFTDHRTGAGAFDVPMMRVPAERIIEFPETWVYQGIAEPGGGKGVAVVRRGGTPRFAVYPELRREQGALRFVGASNGDELPAAVLDPAESENLYLRYFEPPAALVPAIAGFRTLADGLSRRELPFLVIDALAFAFAVVSAVSWARMTRWPPMNLVFTAMSLAAALGLFAAAQQRYPAEILAVFEMADYAEFAAAAALAFQGVVQLILLIPQRPLAMWRRELGYA